MEPFNKIDCFIYCTTRKKNVTRRKMFSCIERERENEKKKKRNDSNCLKDADNEKEIANNN